MSSNHAVPLLSAPYPPRVKHNSTDSIFAAVLKENSTFVQSVSPHTVDETNIVFIIDIVAPVR